MTDKSTWWSITAWNDEIAKCEGTLPEFAKAIYGGREIAPSTGKEHFQGALQCFEQIRMAKIKSWLPTAHIEKALKVEALKKYAMKKETASGEKTIRTNPIPHYSAHQICLLLAQTSRQTDTIFWARAKEILRKTPELAGQLMNPSLRNFFEKTQDVWMEQAAIVLQQPAGTDTGLEEVSRCACGKDECEVCYEQELSDHSINESEVETQGEQASEEGTPRSGPPSSPRPRHRRFPDQPTDEHHLCNE